MTSRDIAQHRMINQGILHSKFKDAQDLVRWMGCIQAQDLASAKWAIGNRVQNITEAEVEHAFDNGEILRTHLLRPMWHIVSREDIRWMLALTAPSIRPVMAELHRNLSMNNDMLKNGKALLVDLLAGGRHRTRRELQSDLKKKKIHTDDVRFGLLLIDAELDGLICSGRVRGNELTYALLDEQVPASPPVDRDAGIAELSRRYFMSRGPATLHDFAWWSGLSLADARKALAIHEPGLSHVVVCGEAYYFFTAKEQQPEPDGRLHMLSAFDEYTGAYKDQLTLPDRQPISHAGMVRPMVVKDGEVAGAWRRWESKTNVRVEIFPASSQKLSEAEVRQATQNYARFLAKNLIEKKTKK